MRLLLDVMCGGLRSYLRICGHDAAYALDRGVEDDDRILAWAREEDRSLVTRDEALAARATREDGRDGILLASRDVTDQLRELAAAGVDLDPADPPTRCSRCNGRLEPVPASADRPDYAPDDGPAWRCRDCGQHYWRGSHWDDVRGTLRGIREG